jgi:F-type H+-transporting ATPase subunit gamma
MSTIRQIKQRQSAIGRIRKITYAMQVIAQTRLAKMKKTTLSARDYHRKLRQILSSIVTRTSEIYHPLLARKEQVKTIGLIMVNSDRGLCGGFNQNVFAQIADFMQQNSDKSFKFIALGRKSERFLRSKEQNRIIKKFFDVEKESSRRISGEISKEIINSYLNGEVEEIYIVYNEYRLHLLGKATRLKILPVEPEPLLDAEERLTDYLYEPSVYEVLSAMLPEYIYEQVYHAILESRVSEEMARMVSMQMATDSADEMIEDLQLIYHKARQALITKELTEITNAIS